MKIYSKECTVFSSMLTLALLSGCNTKDQSSTATIANPASEYCVKKGGKLEIVKETSGEKGMCHLPDGTAVDEWELFRRDNPQK